MPLKMVIPNKVRHPLHLGKRLELEDEGEGRKRRAFNELMLHQS